MAFSGSFIPALRFFDDSRGCVKRALGKNELKMLKNKGEIGTICQDLDNPVVFDICIDVVSNDLL